MSKRRWYGLTLFIGFLVLLISASVRALPATFVLPWQQSFNWSRGAESAVIAIGTLLFGLIGPFSAAFLQRYGARKVGSVALLILVIVTAILPFMHQLWQAALLVGLLSGTMTGMIADVFGIYIANNWFKKNHGLVLGLFTASSSVGQLVVLPIFTTLIAHHGWRYTALVVAGGVFLVWLANLLLMRDYPQQVGLPILGKTQLTTPSYPALDLRSVLMQPLQALRLALKSKVFWLLALPFFVCGASTSGLIGVHFIAAGHDYGLNAIHSANILAVMGVFDICGSLLAGWLTEKIDSRLILAVTYGLRGIALFLLPLAFHQGGLVLILYAILFGLSWNATVSPTIKLISANFGLHRSGILFGWVFVGHQIGGALMAYISGAVHDSVHSYVMAFFMAGFMCLIATLLVIVVPQPDLKK